MKPRSARLDESAVRTHGRLILCKVPGRKRSNMPIRNLIILLTMLTGLASSNCPAADAPKSNEQLVRAYVTACNERKLEAMMSMVTDDIQWLNVVGDKITVETKGKEQLRA